MVCNSFIDIFNFQNIGIQFDKVKVGDESSYLLMNIKVPSGTVVVTLQFVTKNLFQFKQEQH